MPLTMTCPKCDGEIEYDTEEADSGDSVWAQSYRVGYVLWSPADPFDAGGATCRTSCGCRWTDQEVERLDERASELACEVSEP